MNAFDFFFENSGNLEKNFVIGPKETISYSDLFNKSNNLAAYLNSYLGTEKNILLIAPNSVFFIIVYLAIIKSGNVAVPLNPETEQGNLDYIKYFCQPEIIFITSYLTKKFKIDEVTLINEITLQEIISEEQRTIPDSVHTSSDQLAEIIYTSGSTGEPKGVMISHRNLIANTASIVDYLNLTEKDIMLVVLPFYYCYGLSLLHTHLRIGGSIVLNNMFMLLGGVINDLKQYKCTGFAGVPSHFQILLRKSESFKKTQFPDLKYVTQAGGKLHDMFILEFIETFPAIRFNVMYGQTEATARLSWLPPEKLPEKIGSCGKGIPGVMLIVADEQGNPVKPGKIGEILAFGDNIMQGYYKDPEFTRNVLKNRWLRTGDLGKMDDEGYIYLTARKKEIIKVGGKRISPKEIEGVIFSMPEVVDCTIEIEDDIILGETMKATIIVRESAKDKITPDDIKKYCAKKLVSYKIPQIIDIKNKISISATGKKIKNK